MIDPVPGADAIGVRFRSTLVNDRTDHSLSASPRRGHRFHPCFDHIGGRAPCRRLAPAGHGGRLGQGLKVLPFVGRQVVVRPGSRRSAGRSVARTDIGAGTAPLSCPGATAFAFNRGRHPNRRWPRLGTEEVTLAVQRPHVDRTFAVDAFSAS